MSKFLGVINNCENVGNFGFPRFFYPKVLSFFRAFLKNTSRKDMCEFIDLQRTPCSRELMELSDGESSLKADKGGKIT